MTIFYISFIVTKKEKPVVDTQAVTMKELKQTGNKGIKSQRKAPREEAKDDLQNNRKTTNGNHKSLPITNYFKSKCIKFFN